MTKVTVDNKKTGEVIEYDVNNETELMQAYRECSETIKLYDAAKKKLSKLVEPYLGASNTTDVVDGYMFRQMDVQRFNYDKAVLRDVIKDEDTFDQLLSVDKKLVDNYLKENIEDPELDSHRLRSTMMPVGKPYSVTKLEKVG